MKNKKHVNMSVFHRKVMADIYEACTKPQDLSKLKILPSKEAAKQWKSK